jgi:ABC-2 type transport system permease protein
VLREYEIASGGKVTAEIVDPLEDPQVEAEANQTYGIQPTPFQIAGRYEASVINSYFDILVRYGDQSEVLSFQDLIEVVPGSQGVDVRLRNLEYDLTSSVKKVVYGFQSVDSILAELEQPVQLTLFVTPQTVPEWLQETEASMRSVAEQIGTSSQGKLQFQVVDLDDPNSTFNRQALLDQFGLQPVPANLFASETYYLHLVLQNGEQAQVIFPSGEMTEADIRTAIEAALKRTSTGFLKVVGVWTPPETPTQDMFGQPQAPLSTYQLIRRQLSQDYTIRSVDLSSGVVPADIDVLLVVSPQGFSDTERFAIDQYLMRGGSVILALSNYTVALDQFSGSLSLQPVVEGLNEMLETYGVRVGSELVMDRQNVPFPVAVTRNVGGFQVQEIQAIDYPFFVDIRSEGMNLQSPILANVPAVTMNWASPLELVESERESRQAEVLLSSSMLSWLRTSPEIQPDFQLYPELGFPVEGEQGSHVLAVSVQDEFDSFFNGKPSPLAAGSAGAGDQAEGTPAAPDPQGAQSPVLESSLGSARLVVIGSGEFVDDLVLELSSRISQDRYLNNLTFLKNAVDWSVEDLDLLTIRARGTYTRLLAPLEERDQTFWEVLNYIIALAAVVGIYFYWRYRRKNEKPLDLLPVSMDGKEDKAEA